MDLIRSKPIQDVLFFLHYCSCKFLEHIFSVDIHPKANVQKKFILSRFIFLVYIVPLLGY